MCLWQKLKGMQKREKGLQGKQAEVPGVVSMGGGELEAGYAGGITRVWLRKHLRARSKG